MSLVVGIFALVFVTELISWVGQTVLMDIAFMLAERMFYSGRVVRRRELRHHILLTKTELRQTSAQDHFARWAKLRRSLDKGYSDLEKLNGEIAASKTSFSVKFGSVMWMLTTGLQFVIGLYYRRSAVFYLPPGWLGPLTWLFALPFAPKGSVSVGVWQMACRRVIKIGERLVKDNLASSPPPQNTDDVKEKDFQIH